MKVLHLVSQVTRCNATSLFVLEARTDSVLLWKLYFNTRPLEGGSDREVEETCSTYQSSDRLLALQDFLILALKASERAAEANSVQSLVFHSHLASALNDLGWQKRVQRCARRPAADCWQLSTSCGICCNTFCYLLYCTSALT